MRINRLLVVAFLYLLAACAEIKTSEGPLTDGGYVEISNPAYTLSPGAPATIWVPREYVDAGAPRGGVLIKKGYESVVNEIKSSPEPSVPQSAPDNKPALYRPDAYR